MAQMDHEARLVSEILQGASHIVGLVLSKYFNQDECLEQASKQSIMNIGLRRGNPGEFFGMGVTFKRVC